MQDLTSPTLEHLYGDVEISTLFHRLWQAEGWPSDRFSALWLKAEEIVSDFRHQGVVKRPEPTSSPYRAIRRESTGGFSP